MAPPLPPLSPGADHLELAAKAPLLEWSAPTHPIHERSARWYLVGSIVIVATAVYGILTGAWTLTLATLLVGGLYYLIRREPPTIGHIVIQPSGFTYNDAFTHWSDCQIFWLTRTPAYTELHIQKKRGLGAEVILQTAHIDPTVIRATLSHVLPCRSDHKEGWLELFIRLCKL